MPEQDRVRAFAGNGAAWSTKMRTAGVHDKASTLSAKHSSLKLELARKSWANPSWLGAKALCVAQVKACFFSCCHLSLVECLLSQRSYDTTLVTTHVPGGFGRRSSNSTLCSLVPGSLGKGVTRASQLLGWRAQQGPALEARQGLQIKAAAVCS